MGLRIETKLATFREDDEPTTVSHGLAPKRASYALTKKRILPR